MPDAQLPVDLLHWLLALLPIVVLLVLLAVVRWKAAEAGPVGLIAAGLVALLAFLTPWRTLAISGAQGVWDGVFILFVIWPALLLYRIAERAGAMNALRREIEEFSRNELFLVLAFGWVFASFLQGIAGFGTPIAVVAPLLVAIGVRPIFAVVVPLIGHAWANMFGTLAVGWLATIQVINIEDQTATAFQTAILLWIPNILGGFAIAWMYGRMRAIRHAWQAILIISLIHGGIQLLLTLWNPVLSTFIASTVALLAVYGLSHWGRYSDPQEDPGERPIMQEDRERETGESGEQHTETTMGLAMALLPYIVLAVAAIVGLAIPAVEDILSRASIGLPFPAAETGYGAGSEAENPYSPFTPFSHPGTFLLIASAVSWLVYRSRNYYEQWAEREGAEQRGIWSAVVADAVPSSVAVLSFLIMSRIMATSGQVAVLAQGIAAVAPPVIYAFAANWIGVLGAFMTSSNTASNVLFSPLQQNVANLEGLSEPAIIGAQSTGGAIGNAIAPANIVLGTGTTGIVGQEGPILRRTLPWAAIVAVVTGLVTILLLA
ncbi:MAG: L-lactate permease [Chloroflexi bacterium]|nr:L-lactate permease [Chloroflexota bacterium]